MAEPTKPGLFGTGLPTWAWPVLGIFIYWIPLYLLQQDMYDGAPLAFIDALFTATSAGCITGLTVVDTASTFTNFGLAVIVVLLQLGGLGIMVLSTFATSRPSTSSSGRSAASSCRVREHVLPPM